MMLSMSLTNVVVSMVIYHFLHEAKSLSPPAMVARDISFFYSVGMFFVVVFTGGLFALTYTF